jgi:ABC-type sugar transport system ATPase subunit
MFLGNERGSKAKINWSETFDKADELLKMVGLKDSSKTLIKDIGVGKQQLVEIAKALGKHVRLLILDEPTRGIDIGTKTEIQELVLKLAKEGKSVTFISSEIDEMLRTCTRLVVMRDFKQVGELTGGDLTQAKIMTTIAGGSK